KNSSTSTNKKNTTTRNKNQHNNNSLPTSNINNSINIRSNASNIKHNNSYKGIVNNNIIIYQPKLQEYYIKKPQETRLKDGRVWRPITKVPTLMNNIILKSPPQ